MAIYTIYRATNKITGEVYIGFTSQSVAQRKTGHKQDAFLYESQTKFHRALREYGWDVFIWEVIYQAKESTDEPYQSHTLRIMEPYFIEEYDSISRGYNSQTGGMYFPVMRGKDHPLYGVGHSHETCKKISDNHHDCSGANNSRARIIYAQSPDGVVHKTLGGFKKFCKSNGISYCSANFALTGRVFTKGSTMGWKFWYG